MLRDIRVPDFEAAWSDGYLLCRLAEAAGGHVVGLPQMNFDDPQRYVWNVRTGKCMFFGGDSYTAYSLGIVRGARRKGFGQS